MTSEMFVMSTQSVEFDRIRQAGRESGPLSWWQVATVTYSEWNADRAPRLGAALAYYTIFSLAPMLVIVMAVAGLVFEPEQVQAALNGQFQSMLGEEGSEAVSALIAGAQKHEEGTLATVLGIAALVFGAVGVFVQLKDALNTIWKVELRPDRSWWRLVRDYILSFTLVIGVGFLLIVMLVVNAVLAVVVGWFGELLSISAAAAYATELLVSFFIATLLFAMVFKFLPDARVAWRDVWLGAAATSLLFNIGKLLIGLYLGQASFTSAYGAVGTVLVVLVWTYYSAQILFLGAEFTQVYARSYGDRIIPSDRAISTHRDTATGRMHE
jgi:membrane protein